MAESDNLHPVTKLLLARMEEHPEEFHEEPYTKGRWDHIILRIRTGGLPEDVEAINLAIGRITMDKIHADAMDELINGPERRERERAEAEARIRTEAQRAYQQKHQLFAQQANQLGTLTGSLSSGYGNAVDGGLLGQQGTVTAVDNPETTLDKIRKVLNL